MAPEADRTARLEAPWAAFLDEMDSGLTAPVSLHCIGGFVLTILYRLPRVTGDVDYIAALPGNRVSELQALAGPGSPIEKKHRIYLQHVAVSTMPDDYERRIEEMFPGRFKNLRLYAPDPYDLILSKLERHSPKDRDDVEFIADRLRLIPEVLRERYEKEQRPYLSNQSRHDLTLRLWLDLFPK